MTSYLLISIILYLTQSIRCEVETKDFYDLNDADEHVQVVQIIFSKLSLFLNETAEIALRLDGFNKRFDELDQRVIKISQDFSNFKNDISKRVQDQATSVQNILTNTANFNKRTDEMEKGVSTLSKDISNIRNDVTKSVHDRNEAFKKALKEKLGEINQTLKKSSNEIELFKTDISKTVEEHSALFPHKVNETLQHQQRQQNLVKLLWKHGSLKPQSEWNVILRRKDGSVDFNRNWTECKHGFGDPAGEFFVGLEILHKISTSGLKHELLIEMKDADNQQTYAKYDNFAIGDEQEKYIIKDVGNHSGDAEDALTHHMGEKFTTLDRDNDMAVVENCANTYKGPWWFYKCSPSSHLFGPYHSQHLGYHMRWGLSILSELKFVEVKIRQVKTD